GNATYIGYFWSPSEREDELRVKLRTYPTTSIERFENHSIKPPTFIKSNDFTYVFQEIVNTYGVPMHKEINPAVFAIVTFPFLFGVMFGDVGHGFLVFLLGLILILINRKYKNNPDMEGFLSMRYIILMMG
ncbi:MAG: V-type ATPase 116kDa subunit family protein, partial [bacterium]